MIQEANPRAVPGNNSLAAGQNIIDLAERRRLLTEAITIFVGQQKLVKALEREELAQLEGIQRHLALSKSLMPNIIRICRRNQRADTRLAVLVLITMLCDNNDGVCRLGVGRMAQLLNRKEDNVRLAIKDLEANGELFVSRVPGLPSCYWPMVPVEIATMNPAMTWFVDALSIVPASRGRPQNNPPRQRGDTPPDSGVNPCPTAGEVKAKNPPRGAPKTPPAEPPLDISIEISVVPDSARAENFLVADDIRKDWRTCLNAWGQKPGAIILSPIDEETADKMLVGEIRVIAEQYPNAPARIRRAALQAAINTIMAVNAGKPVDEPPKGRGPGSASSYFRQVFGSSVAKMLAEESRPAQDKTSEGIRKLRELSSEGRR
jgi:hypothetical protein